MGFAEDEKFKRDLSEKIIAFNSIVKRINPYLKQQILILVNDNSDQIRLTGYQIARELSSTGDVFLLFENDNELVQLNPFICIEKNERTGYGVYFFDNQKKTTLSVFQAYAEGLNSKSRNAYFERLREYINNEKIVLERGADDPLKSVQEYRQLDKFFSTEAYIPQNYILSWVKDCIYNYSKGVFMLKMERGMGKSVFAEKISGLFENCINIDNDLAVRTYHLNRIQFGGESDFLTYIEWLWDHDYDGERYLGIAHIAEFRKEGCKLSEAFSKYLDSVLTSRKAKGTAKKLLMVFDGLDELVNDNIKKYIPSSNELHEGVYILFTSRNPDKEELNGKIRGYICSIVNDNELVLEKESSENISFLKEYLNSLRIANMLEKKKDEIIKKASYCIHNLSVICRMLENGLEIENIDNAEIIALKYLEILKERYGEQDFSRIKEILVSVLVLGEKEPLSLNAIGQLTSDGYLTLKTIGMMSDLLILFNVDRGEIGNYYHVSNSDIISSLLNSINGFDKIIRGFVNIGIATMCERDMPDSYSGEEIICAHIVELALMLPEGIDALGIIRDKIVEDFIEKSKSYEERLHDRIMTVKYSKQKYLLYKYKYGEEHDYTLCAKADYAVYLSNAGKYAEAYTIFEELFEEEIRLFGYNDIFTLKTMSSLSCVLGELGRLKEAISLMSKLYHIVEKDNFPDEKFSLTVANNYSLMLTGFGKYSKAIKISEWVYEKTKQIFGINSKETIHKQSNLAMMYKQIGDYKKAYKLHKNAYDRMKKCDLPLDYIIRCKYNHACILVELGKTEKALELFLKVFNQQEKMYGLVNLDTIQTWNQITLLLDDSEDKEKTLSIFETLYQIAKQAFGECHPNTIVLENNYANTLSESGNNEKAYIMMKDVYEKSKSIYGVNNIDVLKYKHTIAILLEKLERFEEAYSITNYVLDKRKKILGPEHIKTLEVECNRAILLIKLDRTNEALDAFRTLYEREIKILGFDHDETKNTERILFECLDFYGLFEEKIILQDQKIKYEIDKYGSENKNVLRSLNNLAYSYEKVNNYEKAFELQNTVYSVRKSKYGENHKDTIRTKNNLVKILYKLERFDEALKIQRSLMEEAYKKIKKDPLDYIRIKYNYISLLFSIGRIHEAINMQKELLEEAKVMLGMDDVHTKKIIKNLIVFLEKAGKEDEYNYYSKMITEK